MVIFYVGACFRKTDVRVLVLISYRDTSEKTILKYLREIGSSIRYFRIVFSLVSRYAQFAIAEQHKFKILVFMYII